MERYPRDPNRLFTLRLTSNEVVQVPAWVVYGLPPGSSRTRRRKAKANRLRREGKVQFPFVVLNTGRPPQRVACKSS